MSEQKRFALVIGNENYPYGSLSCCRKDAREMCVALSRLGFDVDEIVNAKMTKNENKYPVEKAKGRADKYTQL